MTSYGHERIHSAEEARAVAEELKDAWSDPSIPAQQWALAEAELAALRSGAPRAPYLNFLALFSHIPPEDGCHVVEVGCGVGHYRDVLSHVLGEVYYVGVDSSTSMRDWLASNRPDLDFRLADAGSLPFPDRAWAVGVEGCSIVHNINYEASLRELVRVSRSWVMLHRVPWSVSGGVEYYKKLAYGVPCLEIHFDREEMLCFLASLDLVYEAESVIRDGTSTDFGISSLLFRRRR